MVNLHMPLLFFMLILISPSLMFTQANKLLKLKKNFAKEIADGKNSDKAAEFKFNCFYMRQIFNKLNKFIKNKRQSQIDYLNYNSFEKMAYKLFYAGRNYKIYNKDLKKLWIEISELQFHLSKSYKTDDNFPADNFGYFFYHNAEYCLRVSEISLLFFMYVDSGFLTDKEAFMIQFLINLYDGDEEIYKLYLTNTNVKYIDIVKIDSTNMFEKFILYNYSVLLNIPYPLIESIHIKKQSDKADIIGEFTNLYRRITDEEEKVTNELDHERRIHYIKNILSDIEESGAYLSLHLLNKLLIRLKGFVKLPVLDVLVDQIVNVVSAKLNKLAADYFDSKKPHEFLNIEFHVNKLKHLKTNDIFTLDIQYYNSAETELQCKECGAYYNEKKDVI